MTPSRAMIAFIDCYSGVSGDMLLGALVDAGVAVETLHGVVHALGLEGRVEVRAAEVERAGLRATQVQVAAVADQPHRTLADLEEVVARSSLDPPVRDRTVEVLRVLAGAEGRIHGRAAREVELHEVGAFDTLVDVAGTVAGLAALGIDQLYASALPATPGEIQGAAHGPLPGPGPATLELLARAGTPVRPFGGGRELVTPTGAALVTALARFGQPAMRLERVGYGAGTAELPWPNVLRLWIGESVAEPAEPPVERHVVLETSVDDMSPQLLAPVAELLYAAGALDVAVSPLVMKKGRLGSLVTVIAGAASEPVLARILLRETTTLGVRVHDVRRYEAERRFAEVATAYGTIAVKLKLLDGRVVAAAPEYESVRERAAACGAPVASVHAAAMAAGLALVDEAGPRG